MEGKHKVYEKLLTGRRKDNGEKERKTAKEGDKKREK